MRVSILRIGRRLLARWRLSREAYLADLRECARIVGVGRETHAGADASIAIYQRLEAVALEWGKVCEAVKARTVYCMACGSERTAAKETTGKVGQPWLSCLSCGGQKFTSDPAHAPKRRPFRLSENDRRLLRAFRIKVED